MDARCLICLELLNPMEISALKCGHTFHHNCIRMWLVDQHKNVCPTCRQPAQASQIIQRLIFRTVNDNGDNNNGTSATQFLEHLQNSIQARQQQLSNVQASNNDAPGRVQDKNTEISALKDRITLAQNQEQEEITTLDSLLTENSTKKDENQLSEDEAKRFKDEVEKLETKIMNLPSKRVEFATRSEAMEKEIADQKKGNNNLKRGLTAKLRGLEHGRSRRTSSNRSGSSTSTASGNAVDPTRYEWKK